MAVNKVANPSNRVLGFSPNLTSGRGALNTFYGVLGLALTLGLALFAAGLAFTLVLPNMGKLAGRVPVVGDSLQAGANQPQARFGA